MLRVTNASSIAILFCLLLARTAAAQPFWSVGPKVSYTFGERGGFTIGWEISYFPAQSPKGIILGYTADFTAWNEFSTIHLGVEGPFLDVGPTLFFSKSRASMGMSVIPWFGALLIPYYEFAWLFGQPPFHSVGGYLKIPIGWKAPDLG